MVNFMFFRGKVKLFFVSLNNFNTIYYSPILHLSSIVKIKITQILSIYMARLLYNLIIIKIVKTKFDEYLLDY